MTFGPLNGIRLIEMDAIGPVPLCGMILSSLGADIIRIKKPGGQTAFNDVGDSVLLRGRHNLELDLKNETDRNILLDLVSRADGLLEGARPDVMERLGLGPDVCLARNPKLVYGRMTGWGQDGPLRLTAGHDINYIAMTGALHAIGESGRAPIVPLNLIGDYAGGTMFLALGMISAILSAKSTGKGQVVDAAMVDGVANLLSLFHAYLSTSNWQDKPASNLLDGGAPFYRCYQCKDGRHIAIGALEPQFFEQLLAGLEIPPERYDQNDVALWPDMAAEFAAIIATRSQSEWENRFAGTDACVSPVLSMREAMEHPTNVARNVFVNLNGVLQAAPAPRFSISPGSVRESRNMTGTSALATWLNEVT